MKFVLINILWRGMIFINVVSVCIFCLIWMDCFVINLFKGVWIILCLRFYLVCCNWILAVLILGWFCNVVLLIRVWLVFWLVCVSLSWVWVMESVVVVWFIWLFVIVNFFFEIVLLCVRFCWWVYLCFIWVKFVFVLVSVVFWEVIIVFSVKLLVK